MKKYFKKSICLCASFLMVLVALAPQVLVAHIQESNPHTGITLHNATLSTGVTLQYAERGHGKGNVILFLHGYTDSWFSFSSVMENLPPQYHAYALTQRGHGDSDKPEFGYSMSDFANDAIALMDYLGVKKATIAGHSMGSVIAQRIAIDYPERVKKLVLMGSAADILNNEILVGLLEYVETLEDPVDPAFVYDFQVSTVFNPIPEDFLENVVAESLKVPIRVWKAALAGLLVDHTSELKLISAPTLIVWGDKDDIFLLNDQVALKGGISQSTLVVYEDTGHGLHWEHPQRFALDLAEFIR